MTVTCVRIMPTVRGSELRYVKFPLYKKRIGYEGQMNVCAFYQVNLDSTVQGHAGNGS